MRVESGYIELKGLRFTAKHGVLPQERVVQIINKEMQTPSCLLEHVAGRIGERILSAFPQALSVGIEITKRNPPMGADCDGATVFVRVEP